LEPRIRDRQTRRGGYCRDEAGVVEDGRVVDEGGDAPAVLVDRCDRSLRPRSGQFDGAAALVHVAALFWQPVANDEGWIAECPRQPVTKRARGRGFAQIDHEPGHRRLRPSSPEQVCEEPDGDQADD
jgi:hypothetical protein